MRIVSMLLALLWATMALAGTLTVTSPTEGSFLGLNNTLHFQITGASVEVTVTSVVTGPTGSTTNTQKFTPDINGKVDGTMPLNFNSSSPEGDYTIVVSAQEPNNTYPSQTVHVKVDVVAPKFLDFSPLNGQFVRSTVRIRATLKESNIKDWTVKVNGQDIPNNTGTTTTIAVDWDTSNVELDGAQAITITARDQANNSTTQTMNVTLDRVPPIITITTPTTKTRLIRGALINVIVDLTDMNSASIDPTGVDVVVKKLDGTFITRVARISAKPSGQISIRWIGRIRPGLRGLPTKFKIVATAIDRAGNVGSPQEVQLSY